MAKKKLAAESAAVSAERAARLYRLISLLGAGPQTRTSLIRRLRLNVRGFYRDLEAVRAVDIHIELSDGRYRLLDEVNLALERLPFPDPGLTLGEARLLARGRSRAHQKIRAQLAEIEK